jgi:hypothetical protein
MLMPCPQTQKPFNKDAPHTLVFQGPQGPVEINIKEDVLGDKLVVGQPIPESVTNLLEAILQHRVKITQGNNDLFLARSQTAQLNLGSQDWEDSSALQRLVSLNVPGASPEELRTCLSNRGISFLHGPCIPLGSSACACERLSQWGPDSLRLIACPPLAQVPSVAWYLYQMSAATGTHTWF